MEDGRKEREGSSFHPTQVLGAYKPINSLDTDIISNLNSSSTYLNPANPLCPAAILLDFQA
jgi:hypothetical protein